MAVPYVDDGIGIAIHVISHRARLVCEPKGTCRRGENGLNVLKTWLKSWMTYAASCFDLVPIWPQLIAYPNMFLGKKAFCYGKLRM